MPWLDRRSLRQSDNALGLLCCRLSLGFMYVLAFILSWWDELSSQGLVPALRHTFVRPVLWLQDLAWRSFGYTETVSWIWKDCFFILLGVNHSIDGQWVPWVQRLSSVWSVLKSIVVAVILISDEIWLEIWNYSCRTAWFTRIIPLEWNLAGINVSIRIQWTSRPGIKTVLESSLHNRTRPQAEPSLASLAKASFVSGPTGFQTGLLPSWFELFHLSLNPARINPANPAKPNTSDTSQEWNQYSQDLAHGIQLRC